MTRSVTLEASKAVHSIVAGSAGRPRRSKTTVPVRSPVERRPCASVTSKVPVQSEAPGASDAHVARTADAEATEKVTSVQLAGLVTDTRRSGVPGSGFTSPAMPMTGMSHDVEPAAWEHCCVTVPALGRVEGAGPTTRVSAAVSASGWLRSRTVTTSARPGFALSAPMTSRLDPVSDTWNWSPGASTA